MLENPMDKATLVLQTFSHLRGTLQHVAVGGQYLITLAGYYRTLGIHHEYVSAAVAIFRELEKDLVEDVDKLNNKLARVDLSDNLIVTIDDVETDDVETVVTEEETS